MKILLCALALFVPAFVASAVSSAIDVVANGIPTSASEIVVVIDSVAPPAAPDYEDPQTQAAQQPLSSQPPAASPLSSPAPEPLQIQPPPQDQPQAPRPGSAQRGRGRRGRAAAAATPATAVATASYRQAVKTTGAPSLTVHAEVPAGTNYRVRVVAIKGDDPLPTVLAGGKILGVKVAADHATSIPIMLATPTLKLASDFPAIVPAGAPYTLAGTITDPGGFLGTKNRMRVWLSHGKPPAANYDGTQISTVKVTTKEDTIAFSFDLAAPKDPTTVYFQFGEVSPEFVREDDRQAAFLVLPDLSTGASPLQLQVQAAPPVNSR